MMKSYADLKLIHEPYNLVIKKYPKPLSVFFACLVKQDGGQSDWLISIDPN